MNKVSKICFSLLLTAAMTLTLTGCLGGGSEEPTRYYTLAVEDIQMPAAQENSQKSLYIKKFSIEPAYQRANIVYRESAYDFMFYDLDLWASRPEHMVSQVCGEYLNKSGLFGIVETKASGKPDFELSGHISAIEEIDEGSDQYAHLILQLTLKRPDSDSALWQGTYDEQKSMGDREPRTTAETMSKLLGGIMEKALQEIHSKLD